MFNEIVSGGLNTMVDKRELYFSSSGSPKISIITCFNDSDILRDNLLMSLIRQNNKDFEIISIDNTEKHFSSVSSALNSGGERAKGDYIIFVHQDVYLYGKNWIDLALNFLSNLPEMGAAGVIGVDFAGNYEGFILDRGKYCGEPINMPICVQSVDEQLIIVPRKVFEKLQFDEQFDFHLYGVDYCLSVERLGLNVYVLPLFVEHNSLSIKALKASNLQNLEGILLRKHSKILSNIYKTTGNLRKKRISLKKYFSNITLKLSMQASVSLLKLKGISMDQKTIVDIGCLPIEQNAIKKRLTKKIWSVGISKKRRYLITSKKLFVHDDYILADSEKLPLKPKGVDIAFLSGLLENLSKEKGERVLRCIEESAKISLVRVYCSNNDLDTSKFIFEGEDILENSHWKKEDFIAKRYTVLPLTFKLELPYTLYAFKK